MRLLSSQVQALPLLLPLGQPCFLLLLVTSLHRSHLLGEIWSLHLYLVATVAHNESPPNHLGIQFPQRDVHRFISPVEDTLSQASQVIYHPFSSFWTTTPHHDDPLEILEGSQAFRQVFISRILFDHVFELSDLHDQIHLDASVDLIHLHSVPLVLFPFKSDVLIFAVCLQVFSKASTVGDVSSSILTILTRTSVSWMFPSSSVYVLLLPSPLALLPPLRPLRPMVGQPHP